MNKVINTKKTTTDNQWTDEIGTDQEGRENVSIFVWTDFTEYLISVFNKIDGKWIPVHWIKTDPQVCKWVDEKLLDLGDQEMGYYHKVTRFDPGLLQVSFTTRI